MRVLVIHQEADSTLGSLEPPVAERGHALDQWRPYADQQLPDLDAYGAVIAMGGLVHPDEDAEHPWLAVEREAMRRLVADGTPVLGVCLGAQILASALGARVGRLPEPEIGWFAVEANDDAARDPLLGGLPGSFPAFQWHEYGFALPPDGVLLGSSPRAPHQAARVAENAWALQFHIEVDAPTIEHWCDEGLPILIEKGVDPAGVLSDTERYAAAYVEQARRSATASWPWPKPPRGRKRAAARQPASAPAGKASVGNQRSQMP